MKEAIKEEIPRLMLCLGLPVAFEIIFQLLILKNGIGTLPMLCYSAVAGGIIWLLTGMLEKKAGSILYGVLNGLLCLYFLIQLVYYYVFRVFFSFRSLFIVGGDIMEFKSQMFHAITANLGYIVIYLVLLAGAVVLFVKFCDVAHHSWRFRVAGVAGVAVLAVLFQASLFLGGTGDSSAWSLYKKDWMPIPGAKKLGMLVVAEKDIVSLVKGEDSNHDLGDLVIPEHPEVTYAPTKKPENTAVPTTLPEKTPTPIKNPEDDPVGSPVPTLSPTPTPTPVDTSPNILDIDFMALAEAETKEEIKTLHSYFAKEEYTRKNEYTGMFEGYNLILITAEGFAPYAMQEGLTPTLNKMVSEGFVFENYYAPIWHTSTIDGEFANTTGLLPDGTHSLRRMSANDMRFAFGNMFGKLGYQTKAYHNHSYKYYDRHKIYPVMGYEYKGRGNGLEVKKQWPGSDLEMMQLSIPEYIGQEPFHVYYMTVSGHMEYTFNDNSMSLKHKKAVADLPYSEAARAYIACNYELELAMEYLIGELEKAGIAERTVIAIATDHYPYGLTNEVISELSGHEVDEKFELYKSSLILWSASMEHPVKVEKYCFAIDIVPTLANLMGLTYDSRLFMGKDILSDSEGLVIFSDKSFITDQLMYNAEDGTVTALTQEVPSQEYVDRMKQIVKNRFQVSKGIIDLDYYSYLPEKEENE